MHTYSCKYDQEIGALKNSFLSPISFETEVERQTDIQRDRKERGKKKGQRQIFHPKMNIYYLQKL